MKVYHIVAVAEGGVIGKAGRLPWHFSADLKHFKKITLGSSILMGRKTFESIGNRPLAGRENFVLTRSKAPAANAENLKFFDSLESALKEIKTEKAFIIGGEDLYRQTMDKIDGVYLTLVKEKYVGDAYYPAHSLEDFKKMGFEIVGNESTPDEPQLEFIELRKRKSG